jgi:hypothetical protein
MKNVLITLTISLATAVPLWSAATEASQQPQSPEPSAAAHATPREILVVGCLVRLDDSARRPGFGEGTRSDVPGQPESSGFALKDAAEIKEPVTTSGPIRTKSEREFRLVKADVAFADHVAHQVEIKGRLLTPGGSPDQAAPAPTHSNMIEATAVRSISSTCPAQGGRD